MKHNSVLKAASVISILLFSLHVADDIVRGIEPGTLANIGALPIFLVWLYGTLVIGERRVGHVIMLLGAGLSAAVPYLHLRGVGVGTASRHAGTDGWLFFVWTLFALGAVGLLAAVLSIHGLWDLRKGQSAS